MSKDSSQTLLIEVSDDGETVQLMDGSQWLISPGDIPTAILWLPSSKIEVQEISNDLCSHKLINLSNGEQVYATLGQANSE